MVLTCFRVVRTKSLTTLGPTQLATMIIAVCHALTSSQNLSHCSIRLWGYPRPTFTRDVFGYSNHRMRWIYYAAIQQQLSYKCCSIAYFSSSVPQLIYICCCTRDCASALELEASRTYCHGCNCFIRNNGRNKGRQNL